MRKKKGCIQESNCIDELMIHSMNDLRWQGKPFTNSISRFVHRGRKTIPMMKMKSRPALSIVQAISSPVIA